MAIMRRAVNFAVVAAEVLLSLVAIMVVGTALVAIILYFHQFRESVDESNVALNVLAAVYFIANILLTLVALFALRYSAQQFTQSRRQNEQSNKTRMGHSYLEMYSKFNSPDVAHSYAIIARLRQAYDENDELRKEYDTVGKFANAYICKKRSEAKKSLKLINSISDNVSGDRSEYQRIMTFPIFLEDLGVMASKEYLDKIDIYEFMGATLIYVEEILRDYFIDIRGDDQACFAHAISLMMGAKTHQSFKIQYPDQDIKNTAEHNTQETF